MDEMAKALDTAKAKVGGATGLSRKMGGITPQAISQWSRVPAERVLDVEHITGVSRHELRPDIYPIEYRAPTPPSDQSADAEASAP